MKKNIKCPNCNAEDLYFRWIVYEPVKTEDYYQGSDITSFEDLLNIKGVEFDYGRAYCRSCDKPV